MRSLRLDEFRRVLRQEQLQARRTVTAALIARQRRALREASQRIDRAPMKGDDWQVLGGGLERIYRGARKAMSVATRSRDSADLHEWRKQVKYLWHELQILRPAWPGVLGELADQVHKLADHLGDDHDLAVLRQKITAHAAAFQTSDRDALLAVIDRRRQQLEDKAARLGARIFEEKPRRFTARITNYWHVWRAE
jgi:CHAD domain-containing protein